MSNEFYTPSGSPSTGSLAQSSVMRAEFALIQAGFNLLPTMGGNGNKIVGINSGGTALAAVSTTGSGSVALATSPTLVTPVLGVASATSINKVALTQPASGSTLTIADGKTLTANNTLTLSGNDGSTANFGGGLSIASTKILTVNNTLTLAGTDSTTLNIHAVSTLDGGVAYTPSTSGPVNCSLSILNDFQWSRVNNVVTVSGNLILNVTTGSSTATSIAISLPVASTLSSGDCAGTGYDVTNGAACGIQPSGNNAGLSFKAAASGLTSVAVHFTYIVK